MHLSLAFRLSTQPIKTSVGFSCRAGNIVRLVQQPLPTLEGKLVTHAAKHTTSEHHGSLIFLNLPVLLFLLLPQTVRSKTLKISIAECSTKK